jgi:hypothetical protein
MLLQNSMLGQIIIIIQLISDDYFFRLLTILSFFLLSFSAWEFVFNYGVITLNARSLNKFFLLLADLFDFHVIRTEF